MALRAQIFTKLKKAAQGHYVDIIPVPTFTKEIMERTDGNSMTPVKKL
jgi:hypothetical protein